MTDPTNDRRHTSDELQPLEAPEGDADSIGPHSSSEVGQIRPPPAGLPRRDRRAWRALELERFHREASNAASAARQRRSGWQQGFLTNPPPGLGRRGRRVWLTADREQTRQWWAHRRASDEDIDARTVGALVIALLLGAAMIWGVVASRGPGHHTGAGATTATRSAAQNPRAAEVSSTIAAQQAGQLGAVGTTAAAHSASAGRPTAAAPLAGRWQPAPIGGVAPLPVSTLALSDPRSVAVQRVPAGPILVSELATPVAAVSTWLTRTCPSRWAEPFGVNIQRGRSAMTTAGWRAADPAADPFGERLWSRVVVPARQMRVCGDLTVHVSAGAPTTGGTAFVGYTADRVVTAPGTSAVVEHLVGARIVVRQSDGRWLVDRAVVGG